MAGRHLASPHDPRRHDPRAHDPRVHDPRAEGRLVDPGARISDGTSVTVDMESMPARPEAAPSAPDPDALVEHRLVGDGTELE